MPRLALHIMLDASGAWRGFELDGAHKIYNIALNYFLLPNLWILLHCIGPEFCLVTTDHVLPGIPAADNDSHHCEVWGITQQVLPDTLGG